MKAFIHGFFLCIVRRRNILCALFFLFGTFLLLPALFAQNTTGRGRWMLNGGIGYETDFDSSGIFNFSPSVGYFFINNFAAGINLNFGHQKIDDVKTTSIGIGPFARYYFGNNAKIKPLLHASVDFTNFKTKYGSFSNSDNGTDFFAGAGFASFCTPNFALEGLAGYRKDEDNSGFQFRLGLNHYFGNNNSFDTTPSFDLNRRWFVGGNASLNTGDGEFFYNISPQAGYFVAKNFAVGVNLDYSHVKFDNPGGDFKHSTLGIGPLTRYYFGSSNIRPFVHAEYNYLSFKQTSPSQTFKENGSSYFLGGGLAAFVNRNVAIEGLAGYSHQSVDDQSSGGFSLRIGFGVYLNGKRTN